MDTQGSSTEFGRLLRRFRLVAGHSQEALAERAGLSVNAIAALERGRRSHPRPFTVSVLADALRLEPLDRLALVEAGALAAAATSGVAERLAPPSPPPVPLTTFVGRESELAELGDRLHEVRLLTLTGAGGTGKTRLAAELGVELTNQGRGPVWFAALDACHEPDLVPHAIAAAVGLSEYSGRRLVDILAEVLRDSDGLLILDNCEHVLASAAAFAQELLLRCPQLRLLATSRIVLGLPGELTWRVPSLRLAPPGALDPQSLAGVEAVRLFVDRAALASLGFELSAENAPAVVEICHRLDGIPLAIELAAARARVLAPAQILARLEDAASLLTAGARTAAPRQRTLSATIEWSYGLLEAAERALFDRLSVFSGGFELEAAEAVAGGEVLDVLASLVDQSLVIAEPASAGAMRYRLLEVLRQFGRSRLTNGSDAAEVLSRHAEHYLKVARRADPELRRGDRNTLRRIRLEHANFQAALEWARDQPGDLALRLGAALGRYWELNGSVTEGRTWLDEALATRAGEPALRATALLRAGQLAFAGGDYDRADVCLAESLRLKRNQGDEAGVARRMNAMALLALARGDTATADRLCNEALGMMRRLDDRHGMAWAHMFLGWAALWDGDPARGESSLHEARRLHTEIGHPGGLLHDDAGLALVQLQAGDVAGARIGLTRALERIRPALERTAEVPGLVWVCLLLASAEGRHRSVARLRGAARAMAGQGAWSADPAQVLRAYARPAVDAAYRELGSGEFERLAEEGYAMSLEDLLEEALASPTPARRE